MEAAGCDLQRCISFALLQGRAHLELLHLLCALKEGGIALAQQRYHAISNAQIVIITDLHLLTRRPCLGS